MRCDCQFNNFLVIEDETSVRLIIVLFYTQSADCKNSEATLVVSSGICNEVKVIRYKKK